LDAEGHYDPSLSAEYLRELGRRWPGMSPIEVSEFQRPMNDRLTQWLRVVCEYAGHPSVQEVLQWYEPVPQERLEGVGLMVVALPGSELNAWVRKAPGGYLVMFSTMFLNVLLGFIYLVSAATSFDDPSGAAQFGGRERGLLTLEEAENKVRLLLTRENIDIADDLFSKSDPRIRLASDLVQRCIGFIIAHEFAHVLLGHLDSTGEQLVFGEYYSTPSGEESADSVAVRSMFSKTQEIEADHLAQAIMAAWFRDHYNLDESTATADARFAECVLFFGFLETLEFYEMGGWEGHSAPVDPLIDRSLSTHSLPRVRRNICIAQNMARDDPKGLPYASNLSLLIDRVGGRGRSKGDEDAISEIRIRAKASGLELGDLFSEVPNSTFRGTSISHAVLKDMIARDLDTAIDCLAVVATEYWNTIEHDGEFCRVRVLFQLGIAIGLFRQFHREPRIGEPDYAEQWRRRFEVAIPETYYVLEATAGEVIRR
jgi:hypothetical protein